jgi:hypothetical protein
MTEQKIYPAIIAIMSDVGAVGKSHTNKDQQYQYRGIDDVYNALNAAMARHGVFSVPEIMGEEKSERQSRSGSVLFHVALTVKYTFYAADGSSVSCTVRGEGMDTSDKAGNKALAGAHKYALVQIFAIPTQEPKDPEIDDHKVAKKPAEKAESSQPEKSPSEFEKAKTALTSAASTENLAAIWMNINKSIKTFTQQQIGELTKLKDERKVALTPKPAAAKEEPSKQAPEQQKASAPETKREPLFDGPGPAPSLPTDRTSLEIVGMIQKARSAVGLNNAITKMKEGCSTGTITEGAFEDLKSHIYRRAGELNIAIGAI